MSRYLDMVDHPSHVGNSLPEQLSELASEIRQELSHETGPERGGIWGRIWASWSSPSRFTAVLRRRGTNSSGTSVTRCTFTSC